MIRDYEPGDEGEVVAVWRRASAVGHPFLEEEFLEREEQALRDVYL
ncbi:MAG: GNAT family N-acetyltransferase, partial [Acidimicrobiia bacterium]|nr:GNAT family N-acetyltransferase [Acidimicrobiia bacterium]